MPVSGKRMAKVLEARGWVLRRVRGSHHLYKHPDRPDPINIPIHGDRDLKAPVQRTIRGRPGSPTPASSCGTSYRT